MYSLIRWWTSFRSSLWLIPAGFVLGAIALAVGMLELDARLSPELKGQWETLFRMGREGSRSMLSAIASSMITVAGVVFSITIVALSLASSQYTSRVLRNFMRDNANKLVLGVFVGVYVYCLVVLQALDSANEELALLPSLAVTMAVFLAIAAIGFLIYFIHHVSTSIQISNILSVVSSETVRTIERMFPNELDEANGEARPENDANTDRDTDDADWQPVNSTKTGYVQHIDFAALATFVEKHRCRVRIVCNVGEFVVTRTPLAWVTGSPNLPSIEQLSKKFNELHTVNAQRTIEQDVGFGIRQLVDVAVKALSPGVNDTTTAVMCVEHLAAVLVRLSTRQMVAHPDVLELGVELREPTFGELLAESFDPIRQNAAGNVQVLRRMAWALRCIDSPDLPRSRRQALQRQYEALKETIGSTVALPRDRSALDRDVASA